MKTDFINPFVISAVDVFATMLDTELRRGKIRLRGPNEVHEGLFGVIGLSGKAAGTVAIGFGNAVAVNACERFLGERFDDVNEDVVDCVGELVNMIAGSAKAKLEEFELAISLPTIVRGEKQRIDFPPGVPPICVPFHSVIGELLLQIGFVPFDAPG